MKYIITIGLFAGAAVFIAIVHYRIRKGTLQPPDTYSYRRVIKRTILLLLLAFFALSLILFLSQSIELTMTLAVYILVCILGACIFGLLLEYQIKRRGGRKIE